MSLFFFDLDETLVWGDLILHVSAELLKNKVINKQYSNRDSHYYDLRELPEIVRARTIQRFADPDFVWHKALIPGVYYFLRFLEQAGHYLGIVTARPRTLREETKRFVKARFPSVEFGVGIHFVNDSNTVGDKGMPSKLDVLRNSEPDYYFDDNVEYCIQAKKLKIKTYLISNKHTPWNHKFAKEQEAALDPIITLRNVSFFPETSVYNECNESKSKD